MALWINFFRNIVLRRYIFVVAIFEMHFRRIVLKRFCNEHYTHVSNVQFVREYLVAIIFVAITARKLFRNKDG